MVKVNFSERRDSVRIKRIITVRHRLSKRGNKRIEHMWQLSTTQDMSASGLLFISALPYQMDHIVEIQVVMSGVLDIFNGYGSVVRVHKQKADLYHVAVKYVDLKPRRREAKRLLPATKVLKRK